jgi:hypothetical protein
MDMLGVRRYGPQSTLRSIFNWTSAFPFHGSSVDVLSLGTGQESLGCSGSLWCLWEDSHMWCLHSYLHPQDSRATGDTDCPQSSATRILVSMDYEHCPEFQTQWAPLEGSSNWQSFLVGPLCPENLHDDWAGQGMTADLARLAQNPTAVTEVWQFFHPHISQMTMCLYLISRALKW